MKNWIARVLFGASSADIASGLSLLDNERATRAYYLALCANCKHIRANHDPGCFSAAVRGGCPCPRWEE